MFFKADETLTITISLWPRAVAKSLILTLNVKGGGVGMTTTSVLPENIK